MNKKVLYLDWPCFGKEDIFETFSEFGYDPVCFFHEDYSNRRNVQFDAAFDKACENQDFAFCFSFNYYPLVSEGCKRHDLPYISIVYDSPMVALFSYTIINPNNFIFLFDGDLYERLAREGIQTVYYMPLPVNPKRIQRTLSARLQPKELERYTSDLSFIGSLYHEDHNFFERLTGITDYTRGYLNAIIAAQRKISGYNFIEELLKPDIINDMQSVIQYEEPNGVQSLEYVYATYFIDRKITQLERIELLSAVSERFPLKLFTRDLHAPIPQAQNMGTADYYHEMPHIFAHSKINLNISLRSITSGIPLRCMDILSCGGFLLTNFQSDFLKHFTPDADYVSYDDKEDLLNKVEYYLSHDKERQEIAKNGQSTVSTYYTYPILFGEILKIVFETTDD